MRWIPFVLMAAMALAGCGVNATRDAAPAAPPPAATAPSAPSAAAIAGGLAGTSWQFSTVAGVPVPAAVTATLRFDASGHISGRAGCNSYGAPYTLTDDGTLHVGGVMSTKMACLQPAGAMATERGVFAALRAAARLQRDDDTLTLLDASGNPLATLHPQPSS